jgi:hypothetical protein
MSYLRALLNKKPTTVAAVLLIPFLQQGAPVTLPSDNGMDFVAKIIGELMKSWPDCNIVNSSPRHPQSQGSVEKANVDVEKMLGNWMTDHKTSVGIHFVAHQKNNRYHSGIKNIPYILRYGQACKVGLSHMNLPGSLLQMQRQKRT